MDDPRDLRAALACAVRLLTAEGLMDMNGHMSARLPGTEHILINARGVGRTAVRPEDIVTVDRTGHALEGEAEPPSEVAIHTRIYAARPDVHSVAHLHPPFAIAFTVAGRPLVPVVTAGAIFPPDGIPVYDDPDLIRSDEDADAVARVLGSGRAVLLRGHGAVVVGEDVETCFTTSIWLEENARKQIWASVLGAPRAFSRDVVERVRKSLWQRSIVLKTWEYHVAKGKREGILLDEEG